MEKKTPKEHVIDILNALDGISDMSAKDAMLNVAALLQFYDFGRLAKEFKQS